MDDENSVDATGSADAGPRKPGQFAPGHKRLGGRRKGTRSWAARTMAEEAGFHPVTIAMDVILHGRLPAIKGRPQKPVSDEERLKALTNIFQYLLPKLSAQTFTGPDGGALQLATLDVTKLMMDPELAAAAQKLALGIASADRDGADGLGFSPLRLR
jgi:hypothetical protein